MTKKLKNKTVNFYHIESKNKDKESEILAKIDKCIEETYLNLKNHKSENIQTITIKDNQYYIYSMSKAYVDETGNKYAWLIDISRLDPTRPINIGDLNKDIESRNKTLDTTDGQGEVVDTQFLYDPDTHVCIFARILGGINKALFKSFLLKFCNIRGIEIAIIPDEIAINKLDTLKETSSLTYTVARIDNLSNIADENRDELKDLQYANELQANQMTMILKADSMNKQGVIDKAKMLFKNSEDLGIKKLELEGINDDGIFEPVDLVQHKLVYHGKVEYENVVTIRNMFDFLEVAYHEHYNFCRNFK